MWTLLFTLLFIQQSSGADVRLERDRFDGFASKDLCEAAGLALVKTHTGIAQEHATEEEDDAEKDEKSAKPSEPKKDEYFQLVRPYHTCFRVK
jgi:hypothetical protein